MIVRTCVMLALALLVIPFGIGNLLIRGKSHWLIMMGGLFASLCIFEVLAILFHITLGSLRLLTVIWIVGCGLLALWGWKKYIKENRILIRETEAWTRQQRLLAAVAVTLVAVQTLNTVLNTYYGNWDDETYCATAVTSWYTDTVDRYSPHTGSLQSAFYEQYYNIAAWPVYSSMLAVLTGVHPAILFRTILPLFEIPISYCIAYQLLRCFWSKERGKALLALVYFQIFTLLAAESMPQTSGEWWLVVNCWTGKALTAAIVTPLILWLLIRLEQSSEEEQHQDIWRALLVVCWASCLVSASLFFVVPTELGLWGIFYLIRTRKCKEIPRFVICVLPTACCALWTFF